MLLTGRNLSKSYGPRDLFDGITLGLDEGERVGLIGPNGSGKTTLLKIFAGVEQADDGELVARRGLRVGYVPQEDEFPADATCLNLVADAAGDQLDDHERHLRAEILLSRLGFADLHATAGGLSGGWRKRLSIARQLVGEPDLLLMDEPTNHLDLDGVLWLESLVKGGRFATLIVTHDRRFLESAANRIVEIDRSYPAGFLSHNGSYSAFLEKREEFLTAQKGREQALVSNVRREIEWLRRGAKARTTKAKGRVERAGDMQSELGELKTRNAARGQAGIDFAASGRRTQKLIEFKNVTKSLGGKPLFRNVDLTLTPGGKLGLLGPNGSGKTTLIRLLTGQLEPDAGRIERAGELQVVVFDQHREQLDPDQTLRRALFPTGDTLVIHGVPTHVAGWARRFLFRPDQLDLPVRDLSGGERARVLIANLMQREADILILDEPTNDLDIPTLDVLEQSLTEFPGAAVLVTHDRFLLERISTDLLALDGDGNAHHYADLSQWERGRESATKTAEKPKAATPPPAASSATKKLTWGEQKELEKIEQTILAAESKADALERKTADPALTADHVRLTAAYEKLGAQQAEVQRLYDRWADLEARA